MGYGVVFISVDCHKTAEKLAGLLLDGALAACVQVMPMESWYVWQGKKEHASEFLLMVKTHSRLYKRLEKVVKDNHPYEVPEILFLPAKKMLKAYRLWMDEVIKRRKNGVSTVDTRG